jgi:hypothetical protein
MVYIGGKKYIKAQLNDHVIRESQESAMRMKLKINLK